MLTDAEVKALTTNVQVRNVIHMLQDDIRKLQAIAMDPKNLDPVFEFYDANNMVSRRHEDVVRELQQIYESLALAKEANLAAEKVIASQDDLIKTMELQIHDNQSLREDYEALLKKYDEATEAFKLMKDAAQRDEETIRELKAIIKEPVKSETFKEVRDERDKLIAAAKALMEAEDKYREDDETKYGDEILAARGKLRDLLGMD